MLIHYTVLTLFDAPCGSLAEVELSQPGGPVDRTRRWLWLEDQAVIGLQASGDSAPEWRLGAAVLRLDKGGQHAEIRWPDGRCDALAQAPNRALRAAFEQMLHQHLN